MRNPDVSSTRVASDGRLAKILGVDRRAVHQAELRGKILRERDGTWDVLRVVDRWRHYTRPLLQRPGRSQSFRPLLDPQVALTGSVLAELEARIRAGGDWRG